MYVYNALRLGNAESGQNALLLAGQFGQLEDALLTSYGCTAAKLQSEHAQITAMDQANLVQKQFKGAAQQATRDKDAAMKAMDDWMNRYIKVAKVALRDKKEPLEKIGLRMLSYKTPAQRNRGGAELEPENPA